MLYPKQLIVASYFLFLEMLFPKQSQPHGSHVQKAQTNVNSNTLISVCCIQMAIQVFKLVCQWFILMIVLFLSTVFTVFATPLQP